MEIAEIALRNDALQIRCRLRHLGFRSILFFSVKIPFSLQSDLIPIHPQSKLGIIS